MFKVEKSGAVFVFSADQPLCGEDVAAAAGAFDTALRSGQPLGVLDLSHVPLLDSRALETLLDIGRRFERRGGCLKIAAANGLCRDILRCTGLGEQFEMHGDVKTAVGSFVK
jgi:anti-anti-sigma factor